MEKPPVRVGIYLIAFPVSSETFIVTKVLGLIDIGIEVTVFVRRKSSDYQRFDIFRQENSARPNVVVLPELHSWEAFIKRGLPKFIQQLAIHPVGFLRLLSHCWRNHTSAPTHFLTRSFILSGFLGYTLDVLHVEFDVQGLLVADLKEFLGCKLVLSARGSQLRTTIPYQFPSAFRQMLVHADGYHAISKHLMSELTELGLPESTPVSIIPPAIDLEIFKRNTTFKNGIQGPSFRILSVGRLTWAKGYEFALEAVALLHRQKIDIHYTIVGGGEYSEAIMFAAKQLGLIDAGIISFAGKVNREDVLNYYLNADVFLHAALDEGFANSVIEAQAMGLPVVASDAGGLSENVENNVTGFVVRRRDPVALSEKLKILADNPDLRKHMGEAGVARVHANFDLQVQTARFVEMYRTLVGIHNA